MSITIETNEYPYTERHNIGSTVTEFIIPKDTRKISIGSTESLKYCFQGNDGDTIGDDVSDTIKHFAFVPANNMTEIRLEVGRQGGRKIYVATYGATAKVSIIVEKF